MQVKEFIIVGALSLAATLASAQECYKSSILSPSPFMGNDGEIFKLVDGSIWEVKYAYEYLYEYYPAVTICPNIKRLMVKDKSINIQLLSAGRSSGGGGQATIETTIVSTFEGLNVGNSYKLANGQIWEQVEPWVWSWVWVNPTVMIYPVSGGYKMKVQEIEHPVFVRRIK